ncbi:MAG: hypothetical protein V3V08_19985 [Nannocystaceae bacterium]
MLVPLGVAIASHPDSTSARDGPPPKSHTATESNAKHGTKRGHADDAEGGKRRASTLVEAGANAFAQGDYETAAARFRSAATLRPAATLHYNIAVCHHRLMRSATQQEAQNLHADRAIEAYNRYLAARPDAPDRAEVTRLIENLGGTASRGGLKHARFHATRSARPGAPQQGDLEDTTAVPRPAGDDEKRPTHGTTTTHPRETLKAATPRPHIVLQVFTLFGPTPTLADNRQVEGNATLLVGIGLTTRIRRRLRLGTALAGYAGGTQAPDKLSFSGGHAAISIGYKHDIGQGERLWLALDLDTGFARQSIRTRERAEEAPECTTAAENGRLVGRRSGGLAAGRASLGMQLGDSRRHGVTLHLMPAIGVYGRGSRGHTAADCAPGERPLQGLGITGPSVFIWLGAGYAAVF